MQAYIHTCIHTVHACIHTYAYIYTVIFLHTGRLTQFSCRTPLNDAIHTILSYVGKEKLCQAVYELDHPQPIASIYFEHMSTLSSSSSSSSSSTSSSGSSPSSSGNSPIIVSAVSSTKNTASLLSSSVYR